MSVDERLPENAVGVWVYSEDYVGKGYYSRARAAWYDVLHYRVHGVTHWMPPPPPPIAQLEREC